MYYNLLVGLILSSLLGALIGSQREVRQQQFNVKDFAGFRTFTLISIFGFLLGVISIYILKNYDIVLIGIFGIFAILILAYRALSKIYPNNISATTEISALITFLIGFLVSENFYLFSITITIFVATILYLGTRLHKFSKKLKETEIFATLKFAIISLIILPLLPNKDYTLLNMPYVGKIFSSQKLISLSLLSKINVFNFYHIWLMVVFISGISYVGYILMKTIGAEKGIQVTGFLGGLMSSTAVTSSFSIESKDLNYLSIPLAVGIIIACSTMFFRIIFEVLVLNYEMVGGIVIVLSIMGLVGYGLGYYLFKKNKMNHVKKIDFNSPFTIIPAIKFSIFFLVVLFLSKLFSILYGSNGIYLLSFFSGLSDVDAITISLSNLAKSGGVPILTAQIGVIIAAFTNTAVKGGIAYYFGSKKLSKKIIYVFSIVFVVGFLALILSI